MYNIGIDVGGTSIKVGLVKNGEIIVRSNKEVNKNNGLEEVLSNIEDSINDVLNKKGIKIDDIKTIGIGIPGIVNKTGNVTCVNMGLKNDPLEKRLKEKFTNTRIVVENDANVAALAEYNYGSM